MSHFPILKTGAVAQYPAEKQRRFSTRVLEFIDGGEQRFRSYARGLRRWIIRLDLLDDTEAAAVRAFVTEIGLIDRFTFVDPWDGSSHPGCVIDCADFSVEYQAGDRNRTELIIREDADT